MSLRKKIASTILASSLLAGGCYPCLLSAQESNAISISLIPQIGYNYSYYHLTSKSYRKDFRITTRLGGAKDFYWGLGLQLGLWNEWKATLTLSQNYVGGELSSDYARFPNLPAGQRFSTERTSHSFPTNFAALNFEKKIWRLPMGAIREVYLTSEWDILFGAGVMWISKYSGVQGQSWVSGDRPYTNAWHVYNTTSFTATPVNYRVGILNAGFSYRLYVNNKARFVLGAEYTYGLHATYYDVYQSSYYYDNNVSNIHESSKEDFNAEIGRHQFTICVGYPILLYRNKKQKEYLKEKMQAY